MLLAGWLTDQQTNQGCLSWTICTRTYVFSSPDRICWRYPHNLMHCSVGAVWCLSCQSTALSVLTCMTNVFLTYMRPVFLWHPPPPQLLEFSGLQPYKAHALMRHEWPISPPLGMDRVLLTSRLTIWCWKLDSHYQGHCGDIGREILYHVNICALLHSGYFTHGCLLNMAPSPQRTVETLHPQHSPSRPSCTLWQTSALLSTLFPPVSVSTSWLPSIRPHSFSGVFYQFYLFLLFNLMRSKFHLSVFIFSSAFFSFAHSLASL